MSHEKVKFSEDKDLSSRFFIEHKHEIAEVLRNTKIKQAYHTIFRVDDDNRICSMCVQGVIGKEFLPKYTDISFCEADSHTRDVDLHYPHFLTEDGKYFSLYRALRYLPMINEAHLPSGYRRILKMRYPSYVNFTIADLNDAGFTFKDIADCIEKGWNND